MSFWSSANPTQKYARIMEIACYVLLLPTTGIMVYMFVLTTGINWMDMYRNNPPVFWAAVAINAVYFTGVGLMLFYIMSARLMMGRVVEICGWMLSIIYNLIPWGVLIYGIANAPYPPRGNGSRVLILLVILAWPTLAAIFSARALFLFLGKNEPIAQPAEKLPSPEDW